VANEGSLRHATIIASDTAITGLSSVHVDNSLAFAPIVFAGDGVVAGVVGVIDASGLTGCARCVSGPREAVDAQGRLVDDETLGVTNPFVDSGDPLTTVPLDFVGQPIPQGGGPDLGAHERPAASQSQG